MSPDQDGLDTEKIGKNFQVFFGHFIDRNFLVFLFGQRSNFLFFQTAGMDQIKSLQIRINVQRKTMVADAPGDPHPDESDLRVPDPGPGVPGITFGFDAEPIERFDHGFFQPGDIFADGFFVVGQTENGIADQLAGPVIGGVPAPAGAWVLLAGLSGIGGAMTRRRRRN